MLRSSPVFSLVIIPDLGCNAVLCKNYIVFDQFSFERIRTDRTEFIAETAKLLRYDDIFLAFYVYLFCVRAHDVISDLEFKIKKKNILS